MTHPDHKIRVGAHGIFSMVLMPSALSPWLDQKMKHLGVNSGFPVSECQDESNDTAETSDVELSAESSPISGVCMKQSGQSYSCEGALAGGKTVRDLNLFLQKV